MTYPSSGLSGAVVQPAREGRRRRFSEADIRNGVKIKLHYYNGRGEMKLASLAPQLLGASSTGETLAGFREGLKAD
jgi:hypothetical protein